MTTEAREPELRWRRRRGRLALVLGLGALAAALAVMVMAPRRPTPRITLTAGAFGTTRALVAQSLVAAATARGAEARLVETVRAEDELDRVNTGAVDFALVPGAFRVGPREHVREVTLLHVEALHLLVREDLAGAAGQSLGALRGRTVDLGPRETATAGLAEAVMAFAGLALGDGTTGDTFLVRYLEYHELEALAERADRGALPDAVFHLATVPSKIARQLVHAAGYRLVALPFADAFRLNALISEGSSQGAGAEIDRQYAADTVLPAFTYRTEPPVPSEPLHTVGTRLLLVANEDVPADTVGLVLDAVFGSRFARVAEPPLDPSVLALPPRLAQHPGTVAYLQRGQPLITSDSVDALSNTLSIAGALVGGGLFLWQWWRQRRATRRDETFGSCMLRVATIERRVAELELSATLDLEPLVALQRELLRLKSEALERFAAGELGDQAALSDLLVPLNAARDHIGDLLLHVRENLEEQAETEGRTAQALWTEAIGKSK
jgi:TRAP-type uncharacterized transport system substrate-binding protein